MRDGCAIRAKTGLARTGLVGTFSLKQAGANPHSPGLELIEVVPADAGSQIAKAR
jgi:hypothetical protein